MNENIAKRQEQRISRQNEITSAEDDEIDSGRTIINYFTDTLREGRVTHV